MRILSVGIQLDHSLVTNTKFSAPLSFLDYDLVIINPATIIDEYQTDFFCRTYMGYRCLSDDSSVKIIADLKRRTIEIKHLLQCGKSIIIFTPEPIYCYYSTGRKEYSGTGKNQKVTSIVDKLDLNNALLNPIQTVAAEGENIEKTNDPIFNPFFSELEGLFYYSAYFKESFGISTAKIKGTTLSISEYKKSGNGFIIFLPSFYSEHDYSTKKDYQYNSNLFIHSTTELIKQFKLSEGDYTIPEWVNKYQIPGEKKIIDKIGTEEKKLNTILMKINRLKIQKQNIEKYKLLISGTGKSLENQCRTILNELGFELIESDQLNREDIITSYKDKYFIFEVKGLNNSAGERNAAQLEKLVSEYQVNNSLAPKPILLINGYRNISLENRCDPIFPNQMLQYAINRNHCLLTTTQLLCIYIDVVINNKMHFDSIINSLIECKGQFTLYNDYHNYLDINLENEIKKNV